MTQISFKCDRCDSEITGLHTSSGTAGFYCVDLGKRWAKYAKDDREHFVCDACVQAMPEYRAAYGLV